MASYRSLTRSDDFRTLVRSGTRTRLGAVTVFVRPNDVNETRVGFAVRGHGAVGRNRIKRRLRAAARMSRLPEGLDLVVQAGPDAAVSDFQKLVSSLEKAAESAS